MARRFARYGNIFFESVPAAMRNGVVNQKLRTTIYLRKTLRLKATLLTEAREVNDNLTAFLEQLIREEWERKVTPQMDAEFTRRINSPPKPKPQPPAEHRVESSSRGRLSNRAKTDKLDKPRKFSKG